MTQTIVLDKPGSKELEIHFTKKGEEKEIWGLVKAIEPGDYELNVAAIHDVGESFGRVTVKGIVKNGARVKVTGLVKIGKEAQKVDDFLEIRLLLLDDKSWAVAEPELEIEANDVRASHAATVSQIDEEQLFYLATRGVARSEAEELIVNGFLAEVESKIKSSHV